MSYPRNGYMVTDKAVFALINGSPYQLSAKPAVEPGFYDLEGSLLDTKEDDDSAEDEETGELEEVAPDVYALDEWTEHKHPRDKDGKFSAGSGGASGPASSQGNKSFKTKKEHIAHLLTQGTTPKELMAAMGWPSVSMPAQAKSLGMKLEVKTDLNGKKYYKGIPLTEEEKAQLKKDDDAKKLDKTIAKVESGNLGQPTPKLNEVPDFAKPSEQQIEEANKQLEDEAEHEKNLQSYMDWVNFKGMTALVNEAAQVEKKATAEEQAEAAKAAKEKAEKEAKEKSEAEAKKKADEEKRLADKFAKNPEMKQHYEAMEALLGGGKETQQYVAMATAKVKKSGLSEYIKPEEAVSIIAYTGSHYGKLNHQIRSGTMTVDQYKFMKSLNSGLERLPPHVGTTFRRASLSPEQFALYKKGMVTEERAFMSTSKNQGTWSGLHTFEIKGKGGRDVSKLSNHPGEAEVLFKSGTRFLVKDIKGTHIVLEEV